jgi:uncharacterized protein (DUF885 family)
MPLILRLWTEGGGYNRLMIRFLHATPLALALFIDGCGAAPAPPPGQSANSAAPHEQLNRLVERYWDDFAAQNPQNLPQGAAGHPAGLSLGGSGYDISAQALADALALEQRYLDSVHALARARLDPQAQLTYDIFKRGRERAVEGFTYPAELLPVNPFDCVPLLFAQAGAGGGPYAVLSTADYEHWRSRKDAYLQWNRQAIANLREGLRRGYTLPRVLVAELLPLLASLGEDTPSNVFYRPRDALPATAAEPERSRLAAAIGAGVRDEILPAYRSLHDFLSKEYLPRARVSVGLSQLPLGDAWYAYLIRRQTDFTATPADLHALGVSEVERLRPRLQAVVAETAFAGKPEGLWDSMRHDPHLAFGTREELLGYYEDLKGQVATAVPALFTQLPHADFAIRPLELRTWALAPALVYQRAPQNGKSPAILLVNGAGLPEVPVLASPALYLREAVPGHHFQLALQQERADLPRFRRFGTDPAFIEGWGVYAASLGEELGLTRDAEARFAALAVQLACAAGLVIDTGLHAQGWTREQAIDYLHAQLPFEEPMLSAQVDRAIALPGEALACGVGAVKLHALRARAERTLGAQFDVRAFHSALLEEGAMPLDLLELKITRWLAGGVR